MMSGKELEHLLHGGNPFPSAGTLARRFARRVDETSDELVAIGRQPLAPGSFHILCEAICGAATLGQAIAEARYFCHLQTRDIGLRLRRDDKVARLEILCEGADPILASFVSTVTRGILCWAVGRDLPVASHRHSSTTILELPSTFLDLPVVRDRRQSARASLVLVPTILAGKATTMRLGNQVRACLRRNVARANLLQDVADDLQISARSLRENLAAEGSPEFREIKDEVRRQISLNLIADPEIPLVILARSVGFSELSTFHRAFRRWTGMTPGEFRKEKL